MGAAMRVEQLAGLGADAGAGWVEDDQLGAVAVEDGAAEEVEGGGLVDGVGGAAFGERARRSATAVGLASTAVICGEAAGEHAGEEADAGVEVPGEGAGAGLVFVVADELDEGFEEEAVDLEEAAAGDPVGFVEDAVVEAGGSGFGE